MSQIAPRAAGLMAAPLSPAVATALSLPAASLVAGTSPADAAAATVPAATATNARASAVPATASHAVAVDASATLTGETAASTAADAAAPTITAHTVGTTASGATATTTAQVGTPAAFASPPSAAGGIGGAVTALIVVIALILALAWLAKRMPVLGGGIGANPALRVVGSLALGPRERVVVVAVGDTQLLLGVGAGGTRVLHTLDQPLPAITAATPAFAQLLAQHFGKKA